MLALSVELTVLVMSLNVRRNIKVSVPLGMLQLRDAALLLALDLDAVNTGADGAFVSMVKLSARLIFDVFPKLSMA